MKRLFALLLVASLPTLACDDGFVKHNHREIPANSFLAGDMTETQYKATLRNFEKFFGNMVEDNYNVELQVIASWGSNGVNAFAERGDNAWVIVVFGGLARHKDITADGLNLVLCHELGHHLGGYPKKSTNKWSSAEGQADYYSTTKCLRRLWEKEDNVSALAKVEIPQVVTMECAKTYSSPNEQALCARMSLAGKSVSLMIQNLDHDSIEPKFETPDSLVVRTINYMHPYAQCRLDTYFNGAVCPVTPKIDFDDREEEVGSCHPRRGDLRGLRPLCWFVPR